VEIYQNCPIFNDSAFDAIKGKDADESIIRLVDGAPITFAGGTKGVMRDGSTGELSIVDVDEVGIDSLLVHDAHRADPGLAFLPVTTHRPGRAEARSDRYLRDVERPAYETWPGSRSRPPAAPRTPMPRCRRSSEGAETWTVL